MFNVILLGFTFMLVFTAFQTGGLIQVGNSELAHGTLYFLKLESSQVRLLMKYISIPNALFCRGILDVYRPSVIVICKSNVFFI